MEFLQITAALVAGSLMIAAFFTVLGALFPDRIARTRAAASAMPGRAVVVGLVNWVFFAAVVLALLALTQWTNVQLFALPAFAIAAADERASFTSSSRSWAPKRSRSSWPTVRTP